MQSLKKLAAILLIIVLFFNWYGFRLLTSYWQQRAELSLQFRLDNNQYDEDALISMTVPVTALSYYESSDVWERVDGEVVVGDVVYRYVKQRIHNGTIELLCLPNNAEMQLNETDNAFFRLVNNLTHFPGSKTNSNNDIQKIYCPAHVVSRLKRPGDNCTPICGYLIPMLSFGHTRQSERPPIFATLPG